MQQVSQDLSSRWQWQLPQLDVYKRQALRHGADRRFTGQTAQILFTDYGSCIVAAFHDCVVGHQSYDAASLLALVLRSDASRIDTLADSSIGYSACDTTDTRCV